MIPKVKSPYDPPVAPGGVSEKMLLRADNVMTFLENNFYISLKRAIKEVGGISERTFRNATRQSPSLLTRYSAYKSDSIESHVECATAGMRIWLEGFTETDVHRTLEKVISKDKDGNPVSKWVVTKEVVREKKYPPSEKLIMFLLETKGNFIRKKELDVKVNNKLKTPMSNTEYLDFLKKDGIVNVTPIKEKKDPDGTDNK